MTEAALGRGDRTATVQHDIVVHLHPEDGTAEIENGPALPASTAQRLACNARVAALLRDRHGNPLYLGRARRLVSEPQLRALRARDGGCCRFPGCTNRIIEAHHIIAWLRGGQTDITNLILLCRFHHTLIHDHSYRITWTDGHLQFHRPDGRVVPQAGPPTSGELDDLVETYTTRTLHHTGTLTPTWAGEPLDPDAILLRLLPEPDLAAAA